MKKPTEKALFGYISKILVEEFNIEKSLIAKDARLVDDLDLDSIDIIDFIMYINDKYKVELPRDAVDCFYKCRTIQDLLDVIIPVFENDISQIPDRLKPDRETCPDSDLWKKDSSNA